MRINLTSARGRPTRFTLIDALVTLPHLSPSDASPQVVADLSQFAASPGHARTKAPRRQACCSSPSEASGGVPDTKEGVHGCNAGRVRVRRASLMTAPTLQATELCAHMRCRILAFLLFSLACPVLVSLALGMRCPAAGPERTNVPTCAARPALEASVVCEIMSRPYQQQSRLGRRALILQAQSELLHLVDHHHCA